MNEHYMYTTSQLNVWKTTWGEGKSTGLEILNHGTVDFRDSLYLFIDMGEI